MKGKLKLSKYALLMDANLSKLIYEKFGQDEINFSYDNVEKTLIIKKNIDEQGNKMFNEFTVYDDYVVHNFDHVKNGKIIGGGVSHQRKDDFELEKLKNNNPYTNVVIKNGVNLYPENSLTSSTISGTNLNFHNTSSNSFSVGGSNDAFNSSTSLGHLQNYSSSNFSDEIKNISGSFVVNYLPSRSQVSDKSLSDTIKDGLGLSDGDTFDLSDVFDDGLRLRLKEDDKSFKIDLKYKIEVEEGVRIIVLEKYGSRIILDENDIPAIRVLEELKFLIKHYGLANDEGLTKGAIKLKRALTEDFNL